jgi:uncharacterized protein (DUF736 family)
MTNFPLRGRERIPREAKFYDALRCPRPLSPGRKRGRTVRPPESEEGDHTMIIGNFKRTGDGFTGTIRTLTISAEAQFEPAEKTSDKSPDYRLTVGATEIGAAWKDTSEAGNAYLSVSIDDPSLPAPIRCALVKTSIEKSYSLLWERKKPRRD